MTKKKIYEEKVQEDLDVPKFEKLKKMSEFKSDKENNMEDEEEGLLKNGG